MVVQSQYLPSIAWIVKHLSNSELNFSTTEKFSRAGSRNTTQIVGANGLLQLSVPLKHWHKNKTPLHEIEIANETHWQHRHWQSIQSAYGKAAYFLFYKDDFEKILHEPHSGLMDLNLKLMQLILKSLKMKTVCSVSDLLPEVEIYDQQIFKPYYQPFASKHGFISDVSVLDVIFNLGPDAFSYLQKANSSE